MSAPVLQVLVQPDDFDAGLLQRELLRGACEEGAIASFTGYVRSADKEHRLLAMELEHYPGMTERSIQAIVEEAARRWPVLSATVLHRIGSLRPGEQIVWVGVASGHREGAFNACEFIMDYLKTRAPFWKREIHEGGANWVEARSSDEERASRW